MIRNYMQVWSQHGAAELIWNNHIWGQHWFIVFILVISDEIHSIHPVGRRDPTSICQNVILRLHLNCVYESLSMLLTFTVTFSYLLLLHTGWHFWENGHTLVDAIIRISQRCQLFAAVRILLVSMKSYWMWLLLMNARMHLSLSSPFTTAVTLSRLYVGKEYYFIAFSLSFFHWNVIKPFFFKIYFSSSYAPDQTDLARRAFMTLTTVWFDFSLLQTKPNHQPISLFMFKFLLCDMSLFLF